MGRMSDQHASSAADRADDAEHDASWLRSEVERLTAERDAARTEAAEARAAGIALLAELNERVNELETEVGKLTRERDTIAGLARAFCDSLDGRDVQTMSEDTWQACQKLLKAL